MMNKELVGLLALAAVAGAVVETSAANTVHKTAETCQNAHAILMASTDGNHSRYWEAIGGTVKTPNDKWVVVETYETGVSRKVSFRQYDTKFHQGGTAYVAHCGHGGTCNELAEAVLQRYPEVGSPGVYCGEVPHILDNPQASPLQ
jgi:hypothetical protein